jgi:chorismate mutase
MIRNVQIGILSILLLHGVLCTTAQGECSNARSDVTTLGNGQNVRSTQLDPLTSLIEERLNVMTDVAKAKWNTGSAIEDPPREQQLLADVAVQAQADRIPSGWAQHFFRLQIEAAKEVQYCLFAQWAAQRQRPFQKVPDLKTEIRPKLDRLTLELLSVLTKQWPELQGRGSIEAEKLFKGSGETTPMDLALLPLWDGSLQSQNRGSAEQLH